jgi:hypothetical protein
MPWRSIADGKLPYARHRAVGCAKTTAQAIFSAADGPAVGAWPAAWLRARERLSWPLALRSAAQLTHKPIARGTRDDDQGR